jgi:hypothetical protein
MDVFASGVTQRSARCSWLSASRLAERRSHLRAVRLGRPLITRNDLISVEDLIFTGLDRLPDGVGASCGQAPRRDRAMSNQPNHQALFQI